MFPEKFQDADGGLPDPWVQMRLLLAKMFPGSHLGQQTSAMQESGPYLMVDETTLDHVVRTRSAQSTYRKIKLWMRQQQAEHLHFPAQDKLREADLQASDLDKPPFRDYFVAVVGDDLVGQQRQQGFLVWLCSSNDYGTVPLASV